MNTHVHNMADATKGKKTATTVCCAGFDCHQSGNSVPKSPDEEFLTATTSCFSMFGHNMFKYRFSVIISVNKPTVVQEIQENCSNPTQS